MFWKSVPRRVPMIARASHSVAAESVNLGPSAMPPDGEVSRACMKWWANPLRVPATSSPRADVLPSGDVQEPLLLLDGTSAVAKNQTESMKAGNRPLGETGAAPAKKTGGERCGSAASTLSAVVSSFLNDGPVPAGHRRTCFQPATGIERLPAGRL